MFFLHEKLKVFALLVIEHTLSNINKGVATVEYTKYFLYLSENFLGNIYQTNTSTNLPGSLSDTCSSEKQVHIYLSLLNSIYL